MTKVMKLPIGDQDEQELANIKRNYESRGYIVSFVEQEEYDRFVLEQKYDSVRRRVAYLNERARPIPIPFMRDYASLCVKLGIPADGVDILTGDTGISLNLPEIETKPAAEIEVSEPEAIEVADVVEEVIEEVKDDEGDPPPLELPSIPEDLVCPHCGVTARTEKSYRRNHGDLCLHSKS